MKVSRRAAIKTIAIIGAGMVVLPSCNNTESTSTAMPLKHLKISGDEQDLVAELSKAIIPKTKDFIGAEDLKSHEFVLKMLDDCQPPEKQQMYTDGLKVFKELCEKKFNTSFAKMSVAQRKDFLKELEGGVKDEKNLAAQFYAFTKGYTLQSFTSSEKYMSGIKKYRMVPGSNFKGCVKI
jgi:hypothetical protein